MGVHLREICLAEMSDGLAKIPSAGPSFRDRIGAVTCPSNRRLDRFAGIVRNALLSVSFKKTDDRVLASLEIPKTRRLVSRGLSFSVRSQMTTQLGYSPLQWLGQLPNVLDCVVSIRESTKCAAKSPFSTPTSYTPDAVLIEWRLLKY